jgi:pyruvate dehydrogenase E2 component (dihydrolipoamide acetyltransferase)
MADVTMPRLSDTMEEGTIASWLKKPGEQVNRGDVIAQIETDKATMDLTVFEAGTLQEILAPEGSTVAIGQPVARIGKGAAGSTAAAGAAKAAPPAKMARDSAAPPANAAPTSEPPGREATDAVKPRTDAARQNVGEAPKPTAPPSDQPVVPDTTEPAGADAVPAEKPARGEEPAQSDGKTRASPMARHLAAEHGLDLANISGSGPQGRVIRADVEAALALQTAPPAPTPDGQDDDERVNLSQMRRTIARRMAESTRTVPHFFLTTTVDASELVKLRKQIQEQAADTGVKISFNDMVVKAAALALRKVPDVNVSFAEDSLIRHKRIHIGVAVATERGLIVPVVRDVDQKSLGQISRETRELAERANSGKLQPTDYTGGTFTISNLGMFGVEQFNAVINPPEAAILAVGAITREPAEHEEQIVLREHMKLTLSVDHRALDGAMGARYLQAIKQLLEKPMLLLV